MPAMFIRVDIKDSVQDDPALCKQLVTEHGCHVFMGTRSLSRGAEALASLKASLPAAAAPPRLLSPTWRTRAPGRRRPLSNCYVKPS